MELFRFIYVIFGWIPTGLLCAAIGGWPLVIVGFIFWYWQLIIVFSKGLVTDEEVEG